MFEKPVRISKTISKHDKRYPISKKEIVPIIGDLDKEDFGLSKSDGNRLINQVSIIFHIPGKVRFKMDQHFYDNKLYLICVPSLIHTSTIYANCYVEHMEERFYSYPIHHKDLIMFTRNLTKNIIEEKMSRIISRWPNIYTFTKAIAEGLLRDEMEDLPFYLPPINHALVGWMDNMYYMVMGVMISSLLGITRFHRYNPDFKANIVPVDFTINALITSAIN
ncbi:Fatty acyl-CoA reductase, partial [Temnothorax longispinosus]